MMKRRDFIKISAVILFQQAFPLKLFAKTDEKIDIPAPPGLDAHIKDYLHKMKNFDQHHPDDIYVEKRERPLLLSSVNRLKRIQKTVGYANYCLIDFDDALKIASSYSRVGDFPKEELTFLEMIFYKDFRPYGFLGEKPLKQITDRISTNKAVKIKKTGNFLYKGLPTEIYQNIRKDIGTEVILTSGIRSIMKQFLLFLNKALENKGNLSLASRSLAPPGYSFHSIGDFDVGQYGFGKANFTSRFTETTIYKKLKDMGYIKLRYPEENQLGVRFEPWHVKVYT